MIFKGQTITVDIDDKNIARMEFDSPDSVNKFDTKTIVPIYEQIYQKTLSLKVPS